MRHIIQTGILVIDFHHLSLLREPVKFGEWRWRMASSNSRSPTIDFLLASLITFSSFPFLPFSFYIPIMAGYTARQVGAPNTLDYRVFIGMCQMGY